MNLIFWLIAITMVMIALLIILPPLLRAKQNHDVNPLSDEIDQRNINIARGRLAELKANLVAGGISQTQYDEQVAELELALSDDLKLEDSSQPVPTSQGRWLAYVLMVAIPCLSALLYRQLGNYQAINYVQDPNQTVQADQANAAATSSESNKPTPEAINQMVAKLAEKLKAEPDNLEGWLMLGRSYKVLEQYPKAAEALNHAYKLAGEKPDVMLAYAEVLALSSAGNWNGKPMELVTKALVLQPDNLTGLWFAAMSNAQQGDKQAALAYLKKLEQALPTDSPDKPQIHDLIANVEKQLGNVVPGKSPSPSEAAAISVKINVSVDKTIQQQANPDDTVFIYVQAVSGPKMPLAIVRKTVKELPIAVTLSDADGMMPNMKLSAFKQVKLLARISPSGNPMPQPGDWLGMVEQVKLADQKSYEIVISERIN